MSALSCAEVRDAAAEYALGILAPGERHGVAAHILRCPDCRREIDDYGRIGGALLEIIPDAEPPLGFERKVLDAISPPRRRRSWMAAGAASVAAAAAVAAGLLLTGGTAHEQENRAVLVSDGHAIGSVYTEGHPTWVAMTVRQLGFTGRVTCELVQADGQLITLGSFDVVGGSGSWGAPEPGNVGRIVGARLVALDGHTVASGTFTS